MSIKKYKSKSNIELVIFALSSVLITLLNDTFLFNPFLIVLIYLAYLRGISIYFVMIFSTLVTSFLIDYKYGLELVFVHLVFFLFSLFTIILKKESIFKKYGSFILTEIAFFVLYLINDYTYTNIINLLVNIIISVVLLYGYSSFLKVVLKSNIIFTSQAKVIVLSTFPLLFSFFGNIYLIIIRFIHLLFIKNLRHVEGFIVVLCSSFLIYYLQGSSYIVLISFLVPGLIASFFNYKYSRFIYLLIFLLISIYIFEDFYKNNYFYQGIISLFMSFLVPKNVDEYINNVFSKQENYEIVKANALLNNMNESISNIVEYLDIVLDSTFEKDEDVSDKIIKNIQQKICVDCPRFDVCKLYSTIKNGLENNFSKEDRKLLFDQCLYPYRITTNVRLNRTTLNNERKYLSDIKNKNAIYKKEIKSIYAPLRNVFINSENSLHQKAKLLEKLNNKNYYVQDLAFDDGSLSFQIALDKKEDIFDVVSLISDTLKKSLLLYDYFYVMGQGMYQVNLVSKSLFKIDIDVFSKGINETFNGDSYLSFEENNHFFVLLSDGIGHGKLSSYLSFFTINALNTYKKIEDNAAYQINNINTLLKSKMDEDIYATLDYLDIDLVTGVLKLYKCGSFSTYIYSRRELKKYNSNTPPLGILNDIHPEIISLDLMDNDIILLMSDGYNKVNDNDLNKLLNQVDNENITFIKEKVHALLSHDNPLQDDITLICLKVNFLDK